MRTSVSTVYLLHPVCCSSNQFYPEFVIEFNLFCSINLLVSSQLPSVFDDKLTILLSSRLHATKRFLSLKESLLYSHSKTKSWIYFEIHAFTNLSSGIRSYLWIFFFIFLLNCLKNSSLGVLA